jgi:hypothetical protein
MLQEFPRSPWNAICVIAPKLCVDGLILWDMTSHFFIANCTSAHFSFTLRHLGADQRFIQIPPALISQTCVIPYVYHGKQ